MALTTKYDKVLESIQSASMMLASTVYTGVPMIKVDFDTRVIKLPPAYQTFLGVEGDHEATTVWFEVDRYFDSVDLSKMTCVVEYVNALGEARVYPVLDIDITTNPEKIYLGWKVSRGVTKRAGRISFALRFYSIVTENPGQPNENKYYSYNIGTQGCQANILKSTSKPTISDDTTTDDIPVDAIASLLQDVQDLKQKAVVWRELVISQ